MQRKEGNKLTSAPDANTINKNGASTSINHFEVIQNHEEVGKEGMAPFKVTYKGKVYNLCCSMCEKDFNKDPEKYTKMMEEEVAGNAVKN